MLLIWPVARAGGASFQYDNNGNMLQKAVDGSLTNFTWDYSNMLTGLTTGSTSYTYRYDGLLNRVATVTNSVEKRYITDRGTVLAETDTSGNITAYYVYGMGLIEKITPDEQSYTYHYDGTGSTIAMTDSNGNIVNEYAYDEFGNIVGNSETVSNPFKYVGQYGVMDEGNGLYNMRARYYDPRTGRFISKDPIGLWGGLNFYSYANNNSMNWIDPWGLQEILLFGRPWFFFRNMPEGIPPENWWEWSEYNLPPEAYPTRQSKPPVPWYDNWRWKPEPPDVPHHNRCDDWT
jgi:RHS repeat-associated protein